VLAAARPFGGLGIGAPAWLCQPYKNPETLSSNRILLGPSTTGISIPLISVMDMLGGTLQLSKHYA
jgi:hypothetical protein